MQSKDGRWKALVAAVKGKREATKYVALVELTQLCREKLQRDAFAETESSSSSSSRLSSRATTSSQALFEALVECISTGNLKVVALGVKCLVKDYSRSSPCAIKGVRDVLFECISQTVHNRSANLKHALMPLVTGIQYCYLLKGWMNTFASEEEYPLLKVVRLCGLQSMECRASVRFAVQMMFQNLSSTIDAVDNFAVAIDSGWRGGAMENKKAEMKLEKVKRMLTHFVEIFLPTLMLRDALGGASSYEVGNNIVLYSLEQLRRLLQTKNMALFSKFVLQLISGQFIKVLSLSVDTFDTRTLDIAEILLDFVDCSHEEAIGDSANGLDLPLQSLLLQLAISRVSQQKPLTDVIPLLYRLYTKKIYQGECGLKRVQSFHLAYLAMQDTHLDSDTIVSLFSRAMHLGEYDDQPLYSKKVVEIVTLLSFANRIKIGQGSSTLISLNLLEQSRKGLPREEWEGNAPLAEQIPAWSCYYLECRMPLLMESILKCLNGSSKSPHDTRVYATSFLNSVLSLRDTAMTGAEEKLVLCILQSLLSHESMEVKHACVSSLREICKVLPSLQDALAIYAFLELKLLLKKGWGGGITSTIQSAADFVLTCNKTPVTLALAKRALECMITFDSKTGGGAAYPRVYVNALDCIAQVVERKGAEAQCEDFLRILFKESQRFLSCKRDVGSLQERAIGCFISRVLKAFPKVSIQWVNVLDQLLDSEDDVVRGLGIDTIRGLCEHGVFNIHSAYRVICKRIPNFVKEGASPCTCDSWIRFQKLFISEDMTEEEAETLIQRLGAARIDCCQQDIPQSAIEVQKSLYEVLSIFPTEVVMHKIKEMECERLAKSSALLSAAEVLITRVVREEMKMLKHKRVHTSSGSDEYANSLWNRTKKKVYSLGKRVAFNNAKVNSGEESFLAQMLWLASDVRPSQNGLKHSIQEFAKLHQLLKKVVLPNRVLNSFQMAETTWNAFMSSWLYASDASGDLNDRVDMVSKVISDTLVETNSEAEKPAKAVLIGYTQIADEQAYQQIPSLLNCVRDDYSPLQAKVKSLFCLSLLIPGLMAHQDTLLSDIVATIISQFDRMDVTDTKFQRYCGELLGKISYYLVKNRVPNSDPMVGSIVAKLLDGLGISEQCTLLLGRIEQSVPQRWCSRRECRSSQDIQCTEIVYGAIVGLGWVARAASVAKEKSFHRAIQEACREYLNDKTREIGEGASFPCHIYSACLMVVPSLLSNVSTTLGDESESTFQAATLLLDSLNNGFNHCLNDNKHRNLLFPLASCIGSLVSILATLQIGEHYSCDVLIEKSVKQITHCLQDEKMPLDARIGCAMAICNIFGCYMLTMPCFETYHKYVVTKLPMESVGTKLISDLLQGVEEVVSGNSEPFLKSVMSWCSQVIYYVMCNSQQANTPASKALRTGITFAKGSYIALCISQIEEYQRIVTSTKEVPKSLENSVPPILRCFKSVHDIDTFDTIRIACDTIAREIEFKKVANMSILQASYEIIASHKNTKDCLVSEHVSILVKLFSNGQMDSANLMELFLSHLPSVLMLCAEENVRLVFKVLSRKSTAISGTHLSIMTWKSVSSYIKAISARKPRRYKLLRDCIIAYAIESLHGHPAPSYWNAVNTVFGKGSFEDEHVWYSISECMSEWQISDAEFNYLEEVASEIPEEKTLLIILMVPNGKVALNDISSCQNLFMKRGEAQFKWMLPVLAMHTCDRIRNGEIDVKQWMLDIIDAISSNLQDTVRYHNGLSLLASVILRCSSSNNISSNAAIWIQYDYSITMLPYSLPKVLKDLPKTFCSMFAHRFVHAFSIDLHADLRAILLPTLCSMKEYFSIKDSVTLYHTIKKYN